MANTVIGTMLKVYCKPVEVKELVSGCPKCKNNIYSKFCPICGEKVVKYNILKRQEFNLQNFLYDNTEVNKYYAFSNYEPGVMFVVMNKHDEYHKIIQSSSQLDFGAIPIFHTGDYFEELIEMLNKVGIKSEVVYGITSGYDN